MTAELTVLAPEQWPTLLEPIAGAARCGGCLRYQGTYDEVRRLRQSDDETLAQGVWETAPRRADWPAVAAVCARALATETKDIQIAAWLMEAWIHLHGFAGAAAGLSLIDGLCGRYWTDLHPLPVEGDLEFRYSVFRWINDKLTTDLKLIPLTAPAGEDIPPRTWADRETLQRLTQAGAAEAPTERASFQKSVALTPTAWLAAREQETRQITECCAAVGRFLREADSPGLVAFGQVAQAIGDYLRVALAKRQSAEPAQPTPSAPSESAREKSALAESAVGEAFAIGSRAQAYSLLSAAADYLAATEPHSPVPHLVRRAVHWGGLGLAELLPELVRDAGHLQEIQRLLQIETKGRERP
jgi:type VI secretion system protein ImpA